MARLIEVMTRALSAGTGAGFVYLFFSNQSYRCTQQKLSVFQVFACECSTLEVLALSFALCIALSIAVCALRPSPTPDDTSAPAGDEPTITAKIRAQERSIKNRDTLLDVRGRVFFVASIAAMGAVKTVLRHLRCDAGEVLDASPPRAGGSGPGFSYACNFSRRI
ncbi:hypothetical protein ACP4OV_022110 [Aristida adscensionis]